MNKTAAKKRPISKVDLDEEISSGSDSDIDDGRGSGEDDSENDELVNKEDEEEAETAQEKKIRLAKQLIAQLDAQNADVSAALDEDVQSKIGKLKRELAAHLTSANIERTLKSAHRLSVTCTAHDVHGQQSSLTLFSGSKDGCIVKWNLITGAKLNTIRKGSTNAHTDSILALAVSDDGMFLASAGYDRLIRIWRAQTCEFVYAFDGHKDAVTGLAFRHGTHQLFSCSFDRSVKVWNVDQLAYVETLFGHQDKILGIDSFAKERCLTCGARDRSLRLWKIVEESQLVFNGTHFDSIDCACMLNEEHFMSGSNDGHLAVWHINKKKPLVTVKSAHAGWICSVAALKNTDLLASGSNDGFVRIWALVTTAKNVMLVERARVPLDGFVNSLEFAADGKTLIAGVGQEHKLGRWSVNKKAKNSIVVIKLDFNTDAAVK